MNVSGAYPQQAQPPGYSGYPAAGAAAYGAAQQPSHQVVYVNGKPKKKKIMGVNQNTAAGTSGRNNRLAKYIQFTLSLPSAFY